MSMEYIKSHWELPQKKKNALVLIAVDIRGKNTEEDQIIIFIISDGQCLVVEKAAKQKSVLASDKGVELFLGLWI